MFETRYVTESDKVFWFSLDKHLSINEFTLKVRDKRGYIISDGNKPIGVMRYNLFWDNTPFLTLIYIDDAATFCHEIDHLDGIMFIDKARTGK